MESLLEILKNTIPVSIADENIIRNLFHKKTFKKDEYLLEAGDVCRYLYFIEKGLVRYYLFHNGEQKTHYFNKENEWVCDYPSFIPQLPSVVSIQALEVTTIWSISFENLQVFYEKVTFGERYGRLGIEQVFNNIIQQIVSLYTDKPKIRYEKFMSAYHDIAQRIPQYYIASYVGVQPQSLSRIRKKNLHQP